MHCPKFSFGTEDKIIRREDGSTIPDDEPVFLIRGKDEVGILAIERYIEVMHSFPHSKLAREHADSALDQLGVILDWQEAHPERVGMGCHTCEHLDHKERLDLTSV